MSLYVSFLLFFISTNPNFSSVFLGSYLLILLVNFIHHLFALDFSLFFQSFFLNLNSVYISFRFCKFFSFILVFNFEVIHKSVTFLVSPLQYSIILLKLSQCIFTLETTLIGHRKVLCQLRKLLVDFCCALFHTLTVNFKSGILFLNCLVFLSQLIYFFSELLKSLVTIFPQLINSNYLAFVVFAFLKNCLVFHL